MMNRATKQLFAFLALCVATGTVFGAATTTATNPTQSLNVVAWRPSSVSIDREMMMHIGQNPDSDGGWSAQFSVAGFYTKNWNQNDAKTNAGTRFAWAADKTNVMAVSATASKGDISNAKLSAVSTVSSAIAATNLVGTVDLVAGKMTVDPKIWSAGAHFMLNVQASHDEPGFFAGINAPVGVISVDPNVTHDVAANATALNAFFNGTTADQTGVTKLKYGMLNGKQTSGAQFGDINAVLGYNLVQNEDAHLGLGVRATFATAAKAKGTYALEPIFGGQHHGVGGQLCGHYNVWESDNGAMVTLALDANVQHLFKATSKRTFDSVLGGKGSKYFAVQTSPTSATTLAGAQPLANIYTLDTETSFDVFGDVAATVAYKNNGWDATLGYNFYGRSAETLTVTEKITTTANYLNTYATTNGGTAVTSAALTAALTDADVDAKNATQKATYSSKLFGAVGYAWEDLDYCPTLRATGNIEFSHVDADATPTWGVALIGGVSF